MVRDGKTNCLNCGAAFDPDKYKCPYCGTSYFDMTSLDLTSEKPVMMKFKTQQNVNGELKDVYLTSLVVPRLETIELSAEHSYATAGTKKLLSFMRHKEAIFNINFRSIVIKDDDNLFTLEVK